MNLDAVQSADVIDNTGAITIQLASPDVIRGWSYGEVTKPETINYRSFKPEKDGLFCEKIFGPVKNWECSCGKYKRIRYRGVICDRCGVEVTHSKVRRERMGHIELAIPVVHIWFFKAAPSMIGSLLGLGSGELERVIYYESYIVTNPGDSGRRKNEIIKPDEYEDLEDEGRHFEAKMGASAIKHLLSQLDLDQMAEDLKNTIKSEGSAQKKIDALKRLKIVEAFRKSNREDLVNRPEWMILDVLPVLPPDLRPLVPLEGGRFATSDLNDLYRRVINRNNRLKKLIDIKAPDVILRNEKRMLQEAVDVLFDNGRRSFSVKGEGKRPLKSLSELLKGKQGRFRQNLLGKRVDYSGRSVIVVGPELKMHQCGLPKTMAMELYKPFIIQKLEEEGYVHTVKSAKKFIEKERPEVWDILEQIIEDHPVLLNRAPTLHRLGIQAFYPKLIEGKAIRLHPLVCTAFNADFDGDQMAVHLPLSFEAQMEARVIMIASNNILHPASGKPIAVPSQDIVLGLYYLSKPRVNKTAEGTPIIEREDKRKNYKVFSDAEEVIRAYNQTADESWQAYDNIVDGQYRAWEDSQATKRLAETTSQIFLNKNVLVRFLKGKKIFVSDAFKDVRVLNAEGEEVVISAGKKIENAVLLEDTLIETTPGRIFLNEIVPEELGYVNDTLSKKMISKTVDALYRICGNGRTVIYLDDIKNLGYRWATKSGLSAAICDMIVPPEKKDLIAATQEKADKIYGLYEDGVITDGERYNQVIDAWSHVTNTIAGRVFEQLAADRDGFNPVYMMADSGARGSKEQIKQLSGMRGMMQKPVKSLDGREVIENPIKSSFREGLNVMEYFISTHGARKGLADTALKTADAGYLTRRLVDVAQDVVITEFDCGTDLGLIMRAYKDGDNEVIPLRDRILGRVAAVPVRHPVSEEILVDAGVMFEEKDLEMLEEAGLEEILVRSVLTCTSVKGVCSQCYGRNLASGRRVDLGEAVGVLAAQSIGEPGTQLTLRTFHIGGASSLTVDSSKKANVDGQIKFENLQTLQRADGKNVVVGRTAEAVLFDAVGIVKARYQVPYGAELNVVHEQKVAKGDVLFGWDPYNSVIIATAKGEVQFDGFVQDQTFLVDDDDATGMRNIRVIMDRRARLRPHINIIDENGKRVGHYPIPENAVLQSSIYDFKGNTLVGKTVPVGEILVKMPRSSSKARDITGGLPRVAELFEARSPKIPAVISPVDGLVHFGGVERGQQRLFILPEMEVKKFDELKNRADFGSVPEDLKVTKDGRVWILNRNSDAAIVAEEVETQGIELDADGNPIAAKKKSRSKAAVREPRSGVDFVFQECGSELIPRGKHMAVHDGDRVKAGEKLCEGSKDPHDILRVLGVDALQEYLVNEIQAVYRLQGVEIADKHIECIARQMLRKVRITHPGDTELLEAEEVSRTRLRLANDKAIADLKADGGNEEDFDPAEFEPMLLGITKSSLATDSFISAASFQETTKILTRAAVEGQRDELVGLKENVIMGRLIPSGTGAPHLRRMRVRDLDAEFEMSNADDDYIEEEIEETV